MWGCLTLFLKLDYFFVLYQNQFGIGESKSGKLILMITIAVQERAQNGLAAVWDQAIDKT
jgi:hypothetical protein